MVASDQHLVRALRQQHQNVLRQIWDANGDLADRAQELGLSIEYDAEDDYFVATLGAPIEALTETIDNCLFLRYHPQSLKIVGFGVLGQRAELERDQRLLDLYRLAVQSPAEVAATLRELTAA